MYSQPGNLLWARGFNASEFVVLDPWGTGLQGWYDPATGVTKLDDHETFHQINIDPVVDPFIQNVGEVYWLHVSVTVADYPVGPQWCWKTSQDHFMGNAVWAVEGKLGGGGGIWAGVAASSRFTPMALAC